MRGEFQLIGKKGEGEIGQKKTPDLGVSFTQGGRGEKQHRGGSYTFFGRLNWGGRQNEHCKYKKRIRGEGEELRNLTHEFRKGGREGITTPLVRIANVGEIVKNRGEKYDRRGGGVKKHPKKTSSLSFG